MRRLTARGLRRLRLDTQDRAAIAEKSKPHQRAHNSGGNGAGLRQFAANQLHRAGK